jgi:hypothetical protein
MKSVYSKSIGVMSVVALFALANADLKDLYSVREGSGNLQFRSRTSNSDLRKMQVVLKQGGRAEIKILTGTNHTFYGTWRNRNNNSCLINIEDLDRDRAFGTGVVEHDGRGTFTRVNLSGTVSGAQFNLDFNAERWDGGNLGGNGGFTSTEVEFVRKARYAIQDKFSLDARFDWARESVGNVVFGDRIVKGEFQLTEGNNRGRYSYSVSISNGTQSVRSASFSRI